MLFDKIFDAQHINDLPDEDPMKGKGKKVEVLFTKIVDYLRQSFPNPEIRELMALTWRLVGNKIVDAAYVNDERLTSIHFLIEARQGQKIGIFMCPDKWIDDFYNNVVFYTAGVVWASSQCRDFWNDEFFDQNKTLQRAAAYEAEFLLTTMKEETELNLNDYQQKIMNHFPLGLDSARHLLYNPRKQFLDAS